MRRKPNVMQTGDGTYLAIVDSPTVVVVPVNPTRPHSVHDSSDAPTSAQNMWKHRDNPPTNTAVHEMLAATPEQLLS